MSVRIEGVGAVGRVVDGASWTLVSNDAGFDGVTFGQAVSHDGRL